MSHQPSTPADVFLAGEREFEEKFVGWDFSNDCKSDTIIASPDEVQSHLAEKISQLEK